jgi:hypothetical protein
MWDLDDGIAGVVLFKKSTLSTLVFDDSDVWRWMG